VKKYREVVTALLMCSLLMSAGAQDRATDGEGGEGWERTREILRCAPRLVDRRDLVEDDFDHRYVTNNPRDIEVGYFSVEPVTYFEEGKRVCEASIPVAGVSQTYYRGTFTTSYTLPGDGVFRISLESNALIFSNDIRIINAQNCVADLEASHRIEIQPDSLQGRPVAGEPYAVTQPGYKWEIDVDDSGDWEGHIVSSQMELDDHQVPYGISTLSASWDLRGPGRVVIRESVIFEVSSVSSYKYDPIFQAACLFSLEPLSVSAKLLPCEE
jgi:hypothetical protein